MMLSKSVHLVMTTSIIPTDPQYQAELAKLFALIPTTKVGIINAGQVEALFDEIPPEPGHRFVKPSPHYKWKAAITTAERLGLIRKTSEKYRGKFIWEVTPKVQSFLELRKLVLRGDPVTNAYHREMDRRRCARWAVKQASKQASRKAVELLDVAEWVGDNQHDGPRIRTSLVRAAISRSRRR